MGVLGPAQTPPTSQRFQSDGRTCCWDSGELILLDMTPAKSSLIQKALPAAASSLEPLSISLSCSPTWQEPSSAFKQLLGQAWFWGSCTAVHRPYTNLCCRGRFYSAQCPSAQLCAGDGSWHPALQLQPSTSSCWHGVNALQEKTACPESVGMQFVHCSRSRRVTAAGRGRMQALELPWEAEGEAGEQWVQRLVPR